MERRSGSGELLAAVLQLVASVALYLLVEADERRLQAWRMRAWHTAGRTSWWLSYRFAALGLRAERGYDRTKG